MTTICVKCKDAACEAVQSVALEKTSWGTHLHDEVSHHAAIRAIRALPEQPPQVAENELVERMAIAIARTRGGWRLWEDLSFSEKKQDRLAARAALAVVREAEGGKG